MTITLYDYIICGAGSAGCVLAARLCEDPDCKVLLIEAGGKANSLFVTMPAGNGFLFGNPTYDWGFYSTPQPGLNGRKIYYPRGKGLGGSSILNGMIYIRGHQSDFERWQAMGLEGWGYVDVLPYFKRGSTAQHRDSHYHGDNGPLKLTPACNFDEINQRFLEAAQQAGHVLTDDFNGEQQLGVGRLDAKVWKGKRQSSRAAYLNAVPKNLTILSNTTVTGLLWEGQRASGVKVRQQNSEQIIYAEAEILVSLGAFGSPQLLMLSGIGPAQHLQDKGISVKLDLPAVGSHLHDHPNLPLQFILHNPKHSLARFQRPDLAVKLGLQYLLTGTGPGAGPFWSTMLFQDLDNDGRADLQTYLTPMIVREEAGGSGWSLENLKTLGRSILARGKTAESGLQFDINLLRPRSSGTVQLASSDPLAAPLIDPGYLQDEQDIADLKQGLQAIREIVQQPAIREAVGAEVAPGIDLDGTELIQRIRETVTTGHHPVSTCRMGGDNDPEAVLDAQFRVRGVEGLRVIDASVFPDQIGGNPNAVIMMMAEKAVDMIRNKDGQA